MDHLIVLFDVITLIVGASVALYTYQSFRSHRFAFLKSLFHYILFYNLAVTVHFIANYTMTNLYGGSFSAVHPLVVATIYAVGFVAEIGLAYALVRFARDLRGGEVSKTTKILFALGVLSFVLSYLVGLTSYLAGGTNRLLALAYSALVVTAMGVIFAVLLVLLLERREDSHPSRDRVRRGFAYLLLSGYLSLALSVFLPEAFYRYLSSLMLLWLNLVPYLWIQRFLLPQSVQFSSTEGASLLDDMVREYGISNREREVMELILEGKTNKEIEQLLFISFSTVKNHVYNLFQKLGVKSRGHLVHMVSEYQKPPVSMDEKT